MDGKRSGRQNWGVSGGFGLEDFRGVSCSMFQEMHPDAPSGGKTSLQSPGEFESKTCEAIGFEFREHVVLVPLSEKEIFRITPEKIAKTT